MGREKVSTVEESGGVERGERMREQTGRTRRVYIPFSGFVVRSRTTGQGRNESRETQTASALFIEEHI